MKTFYFFGDSITLGVNVIKDDAWTSLINTHLKAHGVPVPPSTFYILGVRKNSAKSIAERLENEFNVRNIQGSEPYFIFMFGTVDTAAPAGKVVLEQEESLKYAKQIFEMAQKHGKCLFVSSPPVLDHDHNQRLAELIKEQEKVCQQMNVAFIDVHTALTQNPVYIQDLSDGIHPEEMGNAAISDIICQSPAMQDWLAECSTTVQN